MKKFLAILVVFTLIFGLYACNDNNTTGNNPDPNQTDPTDTTDPTDQTTTPSACETDDEFADYIIQILKDIANVGDALYKSTIGDVTAPLVTVAEVEANAETWKTAIKMSISNPDIVADVSNDGVNKIYTFYLERILHVNSVGTHMGHGIPGYAGFDRETGLAKFKCKLQP